MLANLFITLLKLITLPWAGGSKFAPRRDVFESLQPARTCKVKVAMTEDYPRKGSKQAGGVRAGKCCALCLRVVPVAPVRQEEKGGNFVYGHITLPLSSARPHLARRSSKTRQHDGKGRRLEARCRETSASVFGSPGQREEHVGVWPRTWLPSAIAMR